MFFSLRDFIGMFITFQADDERRRGTCDISTCVMHEFLLNYNVIFNYNEICVPTSSLFRKDFSKG